MPILNLNKVKKGDEEKKEEAPDELPSLPEEKEEKTEEKADKSEENKESGSEQKEEEKEEPSEKKDESDDVSKPAQKEVSQKEPAPDELPPVEDKKESKEEIKEEKEETKNQEPEQKKEEQPKDEKPKILDQKLYFSKLIKRLNDGASINEIENELKSKDIISSLSENVEKNKKEQDRTGKEKEVKSKIESLQKLEREWSSLKLELDEKKSRFLELEKSIRDTSEEIKADIEEINSLKNEYM